MAVKQLDVRPLERTSQEYQATRRGRSPHVRKLAVAEKARRSLGNNHVVSYLHVTYTCCHHLLTLTSDSPKTKVGLTPSFLARERKTMSPFYAVLRKLVLCLSSHLKGQLMTIIDFLIFIGKLFTV